MNDLQGRPLPTARVPGCLSVLPSSQVLVPGGEPAVWQHPKLPLSPWCPLLASSRQLLICGNPVFIDETSAMFLAAFPRKTCPHPRQLTCCLAGVGEAFGFPCSSSMQIGLSSQPQRGHTSFPGRSGLTLGSPDVVKMGTDLPACRVGLQLIPSHLGDDAKPPPPASSRPASERSQGSLTLPVAPACPQQALQCPLPSLASSISCVPAPSDQAHLVTCPGAGTAQGGIIGERRK